MTRANQEFFVNFRKEISGDVTPPTNFELMEIPHVYFPGKEPHNSLAYTKLCVAKEQESNDILENNIGIEEIVTSLKSKVEEQEKIIRGKNEYIARLESEKNVAENYTDDEKNDSERLDTTQLIILFETLLNVTLDAAHTNISALSRFIAKVSGYKDGAIRAKINQKAKGFYDNAKAKRDAAMLVDLLKSIDKKNELRVVSRLKENFGM